MQFVEANRRPPAWLVQLDVAANIFDFVLSDDEMRQISLIGNAKIRLTDFGFAPKWD